MNLINNSKIKDARISARVTKEELIVIRKYANAKGYENCSEFIRDLLNEKLQDFSEVISGR